MKKIDGDKAENFWDKCENLSNCIIIARSNYGKVFGAYRSKPFEKKKEWK